MGGGGGPGPGSPNARNSAWRALEGDAAVDDPQGRAAGAAGMLRSIPVEQVRPGPYQARRHFDAARLAELASTMREHGVMQPLVVRPVGDGFELVAGERRWRAARMAGLPSVPALVREISDREAAVLSLVENLQRDDLQFFDEAEGYRQLGVEFKLSQEEVAQAVGRSQPTVANKLRLLRLEGTVRERIVGGGLTERHARALLSLGSVEERLAAVDAFVAQGLSVREAEAWVQRRGAAGAADKPQAAARTPHDLGALRRAFAETARGLRQAGYRVRVEAHVEGDGWVVQVRVRARDAAAGQKRRRG